MKTALAALTTVLVLASAASAAERVAPSRAAAYDGDGFKLLTTKVFLGADFDQETFDNLWRVWEEPQRSQAEQATPEDAAPWRTRATD